VTVLYQRTSKAQVHQSSMELVELRANIWGPPHKAKYSSTTDSEPVRRLNDEKHPDKGSEKYLKPCAYKRWELTSPSGLGGDRVPFA
jgi:hypothetical protein